MNFEPPVGYRVLIIRTLERGHEIKYYQDGKVFTLEKALEIVKVAIPMLTPNREEKRQNGRRFKEDGEEMFTLTAQDQHGVMVKDEAIPKRRIRRLTPKECERLMGLEDDWTRWGIDEDGNEYEVSDTQRYRMAGNGVVVDVVREIIRRLVNAS